MAQAGPAKPGMGKVIRGMQQRTHTQENGFQAEGAQAGIARPAFSRPRLSLGIAVTLAIAVGLSGFALEAPAVPASAKAAAASQPALPGSDQCLECHPVGLQGRTKAGEAPAVDVSALRHSPHSHIECATCHEDVNVNDLPHAEKLKKVTCGNCHINEASQYVESLHGTAAARGEKLAPTCKSCHGTHSVLLPADYDAPTNKMNIPALCNGCHREGSPVQSYYHIPQDSILTNYTESIHGEGLFKKGLLTTAVCTSCHTAHHQLPHTDPRSSIARINVAKTCTQCHVRIEKVHVKVIRGELWEKRPNDIPACVDCHQPHRVRKAYYAQGMASEDCMMCHGRKDLMGTHDGKRVSMFVDQDEVQHSRHAKIACAQCHTGITPSNVRPCVTVIPRVDCSICHAQVVDTYKTSVHGQLNAKGSPDAPVCADCHGTHGIKGHLEPEAKTYAKNVPALCGGCHRTGNKAANRYKGPETQILEHYTESIHGKGLLESGLVVTATCVDCHTTHGELPAKDPRSSVNPANVASTCGTCHRGIYETFEQSIHSPTVSKSKDRLPVCSDCHSAHTISRTDQEGFRLNVMNQCGKCHAELVKSYFDTYHGKVSKLGYQKTAKCFDCHGAHDMLPAWNPKSHLSRQNIVKTCQQCHPGSNRRFAGYLTHATHHDPRKYPILFVVFWGMTSLLVGTFLVAGLHTLAWLPRSLQYRRQLAATHATESKQHYRRFPKLYRNLHIMVIVSFIGLALTGMTLKFSYTGWAWALSRVLGGFEAAGFIHRVCALITFSYFGIHISDMLRRKKASGQSWLQFITGPSGMLPGPQDGAEALQSIKWFLGKGKRPDYGRWTYWEKFDYFAVFWGVAIIGATGLLLWFPTVFTNILPGWLLNVATIVHSDEALLAVGFIFTVHFFNTHFRPEKFPMDTVIFTGTVPLDEFKIDRPREYDALVEAGELEQHLEPAPSVREVKVWKIFGTVALSLGILLILLILYAAIFGYR
jgi:cytochrome b subunit of formate dehydrogenase